MFFQLKLQTFFIQVGSDKAEIHKMARWHLVYHLLSSGGRKKKQECSVSSCWIEKFSYYVIYFDALVTSKMKTVSEQCVRVVLMILSDQNKFREMCTGALCRCAVNLLKSCDHKIRKFERIWRRKHEQTSEVTLNVRLHCSWIYVYLFVHSSQSHCNYL